MALRRIETITNNSTGLSAKVYRDVEWDEYRVKFYQDEKHLENSDYHTQDKGDAQRTARTVWYPRPLIAQA